MVGCLMGQVRSVKYFQWSLIQCILTWYQTHTCAISTKILPMAMHGKDNGMCVCNYNERKRIEQ